MATGTAPSYAPTDGTPSIAFDAHGRTVTIRAMDSAADFAACVQLQRDTWGADYDIVPAAVLKIVQRVGGCVIGATNEQGELEGFVFGVTGVEDGQLVHWSHMLAVRPGTRGAGIGRRLKEAQRDRLQRLGVTRIYWTFDPLVARNAHLNLSRLGAEVVEYVPDMYGESQSPLHRGVGTDRFVVVWHIGGEHGATAASRELPPAATQAPIANASGPGEPAGDASSLPRAPMVRVAVPADIERVQAASLDLAAGWRRSTRRAIQFYLDRDYAVRGFYSADGFGYYVLAAPHSNSGS